MATIADTSRATRGGDERFFLGGAFAMALVIVAGFSMQLAVGRSSFSAPLLVHAHAVVFMGWVGIFVLQNVFVATGRQGLHRLLGWVAAAWMVPMLVMGWLVTVEMLRRGGVPFFFRPLQFLVFDPLSLLTFMALTTAAILLRRKTDWHRRLHFCGMAVLLGPGFGRLLPMPLLVPWAWEATALACLAFPFVGMFADWRRTGRVHPAWGWGVAALLGLVVLTEAITYSPLGVSLYGAVVAGSPGAAVPPLEFPPAPGAAPIAP